MQEIRGANKFRHVEPYVLALSLGMVHDKDGRDDGVSNANDVDINLEEISDDSEEDDISNLLMI